ncbi:hypothetical protein EXM98_18165 [Clostridium botulinum]|nr:hypothetical protein [Clostridium botulinum]NFK36355.1 hypothetical protein [Clostridium botulinum H04402 065]NEZ97580.1 hypothetical protein [Clostridium botulinum]NFA10774.1 hypothetical protein [Clostridium botulinum]NFA28994.1 hypothetical protein [Clostridium botulinum]
MVPSSSGPVAPLGTVIPLEPATPLGQVHLPQHGMYILHLLFK